MRRAAIFLDRDGVLIENRADYVKTWDEVQIFPFSVEALRLIQNSRLVPIVVTNQAIVGRGRMRLEEVETLNQRILDAFAELGTPLFASYLCPHHPDDGCDCRKPQPGMLLEAARQHELDLGRSFMIGDAVTDMHAAEAAGVKGMLVRTGRGLQSEGMLTEEQAKTWPIFENMLVAVKSILKLRED